MADRAWRKLGPAPAQAPDPPLYDPQELLGLTPQDFRVPVDPREILAELGRRGTVAGQEDWIVDVAEQLACERSSNGAA